MRYKNKARGEKYLAIESALRQIQADPSAFGAKDGKDFTMLSGKALTEILREHFGIETTRQYVLRVKNDLTNYALKRGHEG